MEKDTKLTKEQKQAADKYAGAAINVADEEKVSAKLVKERIKVENNNPRNND